VSGFSAGWLALREPADRRARSAELDARAAALVAGRAGVRVLDLACGTGAGLRALAPRLGPRQHWRLVDADPALLELATCTEIPGVALTVATERRDLGAALPGFDGLDLVTASALLDLVSAGWLERLAEALRAARLPLLAALTYDGTAAWMPEHPLDRLMTAALAAHQRRDKGFGPALGSEACRRAEAVFQALGFTVERRPSPWALGPADAALQSALAQSVAQAARELGDVPQPDIAAWLAFRQEAAVSGGEARVGHEDLLAVPGPA